MVVATDTVKNIAYVVAKANHFTTAEEFALLYAQYMLDSYAHITKASLGSLIQPTRSP
jgi:urate oxidase